MTEHWCEKSTTDVTSFMMVNEVRTPGVSVHSAFMLDNENRTRNVSEKSGYDVI